MAGSAPSDPALAALLQRAAGLLGQGQAAEALDLCRSALAQHSRSAELHHLVAASAQRAGDPGLAERHYRQALLLRPEQAQLHLHLGVLLAQLRREAEAESCLRQALRLEPRSAQAQYNLARLLSQRGRLPEAEQQYRQALALNPQAAEVLYNLASLLAQQGRIAEAEAGYRHLLQLQPRHGDAWSNLAALLMHRRDFGAAADCYRRLLTLSPDHPETLLGLAWALQESGQTAEALACCRRIDPARLDDAASLSRLGALLVAGGALAEGESQLRRALALDPDFALAHYNLGTLLERQGRTAEAEASYRQALMREPQSLTASFNLAVLLDDSGRDAEAEAAYRRVLELDPDNAGASRNLASLLLQQGRYTEGWLRYEARYSPAMVPRTIYPPELPFPQWRGESLAGRSILLWPEQGYGDQIQLCRYVPLLKQRGAAQVTLVCPAPLAALFETLPGVDRVIAEGTPGPVAMHDCWSLLLSLPHCLGPDAAGGGILDRLPYLSVPASRQVKWAGRIPLGGLRVGLVWRGSSAHAHNEQRSLGGLPSLAALWTVPGVRFFSLQKGDGEDEARQPPPGQPLVHLGAEIDDFADAAALVEQLDLVICVDTAIAHLAGALGKACWMLLPARPDWRYTPGREDTPWYPDCLRLFGRGAGEDWAPVVERMRQALAAILSPLPLAGEGVGG